ncbi:MAG: histidinol-phosphate transaminase [Armatimonadota bacterium]
MTPYLPGRPIADVQREFGLIEVVKLASNENPNGPSPKAIEAVTRAAQELHTYPDGAALALKAAISEKFKVAPDRIVVGNGSDELLHLLGLILLDGAKDEVVMGHPSFSRYDASAHLSAARLIKVPLDPEYRHDLPAMAAAVTPQTKIVFIANPNNPTGTTVSRAEVTGFLDAVPGNVTVVLDEAYFEFAATDPDFPSSLEFLDRPNVVGLRTFSKTYGLAGIRVGYGFFPRPLADAMDRAREPFDVNALAQVAAIAALRDEEHLALTIKANAAGLMRLGEILREVGAVPIPSRANFVLADFGRPAHPIFEALLREGVIVRSGLPLGAPNCLRISVGTPAEIEKFGAALRRVLEAVPA